MTSDSRKLAGAAALALAACNVSYTSPDGSDSVSVGRNSATGRVEANVKADGRDVTIDPVRGADIRLGNGTSVNLSDGDVRASIRTDDNRSVSIVTNRQ